MSRDLSFAPRRRHVPRWLAGIGALAYPAAVLLALLSTGFRQVGDMADLASSYLAAMLFLVAAPTAWIFAFDFIDVSRFTVIAAGLATSLPLWYLVGAALADGADHWSRWLRRYLSVVVVWTTTVIVLLGLAALVSG